MAGDHRGRAAAVGGRFVAGKARARGRAAFAFSPDGKLLAADTAHGAVRLVDPDTGREYARLENPNQDRARFLSFSPDGTQLVATKGDSQSIHVWDLRAIRQQLAKMGLDWALPPYPPAPEVNESQPLQIQVELGDLALLLRDREADHAAVDRAETSRPGGESERCQGVQRSRVDLPDRTRSTPRLESRAAVAQKAVQLVPDAMNRNTLGLAYYRAGRYREAVETLEPNLKDQVDWALTYDLYFLAMSHHQLGESARAREFYDLADPLVRRTPRGAQLVCGGIGCHRGRSSGIVGSERQEAVTAETPRDEKNGPLTWPSSRTVWAFESSRDSW